MKDCIFCKIANGEIASKKIIESESFFVIKDINPKSKWHSLIIPIKHFENLIDFSSIYGEELIDVIQETYKKLKEEDNSIEGFNFIVNNSAVAGQLVPHLHFHVVPRRKGDGLNMWV